MTRETVKGKIWTTMTADDPIGVTVHAMHAATTVRWWGDVPRSEWSAQFYLDDESRIGSLFAMIATQVRFSMPLNEETTFHGEGYLALSPSGLLIEGKVTGVGPTRIEREPKEPPASAEDGNVVVNLT